MNTLTVSLILATGGLLTAFYTLLTNIRDRKRNVTKQETDLALSKGTYEQIAADAAKINSDERIATERWWKEQFDAVKDELTIERAQHLQERRWRRKVTQYIREHRPWDLEASKRLEATDNPMPPPPVLDIDDEDDFL